MVIIKSLHSFLSRICRFGYRFGETNRSRAVISILAFVFFISSACGDPAKSGTVAKYKGGSIEKEQLDEKAGMELYRNEIKAFEIRYRALIEMLGQQLLQIESEETGKSPEELIQNYTQENMPLLTDDILLGYYNSQNFRQPFAEIKDQLKNQLEQQLQARTRYEYYRTLMEKYEAEILLSEPVPPLIQVNTAGLPFWGNEKAAVTIVEFSDYECPYCKSMQPEIQKIKASYSDQIKWVFFDFPLSFHHQAHFAHLAAHCAGEQNAYFEMHRELFNLAPQLSPESIKSAARSIKLNQSKFEACLANSANMDQKINDNIEQALELGINSTPTLLINGKPLNARSYDDIQNAIQSALKENR